MHIYNWYHTITTGILLHTRIQITIYTWRIPLADSPLLPFAPLSNPSLLTWNPPCCDRIRPPRTQVARKLTSPFPSPGSYTPPTSKSRPPGFSSPNIHSLGRHCEPDPQARVH
jgi:hypothetical protein